jgi:ankyrin repeat protein
VLHRTPNLSALLERAKSGDAAQAVKAYLDARGSPHVLVRCGVVKAAQPVLLLHCMALHNLHPHRELAASVELLIEAGADVNAVSDDGCTALMCAIEGSGGCTKVLQVFLQAGADTSVQSTVVSMTVLHKAAAAGPADCCEVLLAGDNGLVHVGDVNGYTAVMYAVCGNC